MVLPDVILDEYASDLRKENLAEMLRLYDEAGYSQSYGWTCADGTSFLPMAW